MATIEERLRNAVTVRRLALVIMAITIFILFRPLFLPIRIGFQTIDFNNRIEALKPGDIVCFSQEFGPGTLLGERRDIYRALIDHLLAKKVKIVFHPTSTMWAAGVEALTKLSGLSKLTYGVDFVYLPYSAGEEVAWAAFAADIHGFFKTDVYGTPLSELPLMQNIRTLKDFDLLLVQYGIFTWGEMYIRQWPAKYGVPMITLAQYTTLQAWYGSYVLGNLDMDLGFAEYQSLNKVAGEHIIRMEVRNLIVTIVVGLVLVGTVLHWASRPARKETARTERAA